MATAKARPPRAQLSLSSSTSPKRTDGSTRDLEQVRIAVLTLISNIFFARKLLPSDCFHSIGKVRLNKQDQDWRSLLRTHPTHKKKSDQTRILWKPLSTVLFQQQHGNRHMDQVLEQLKEWMDMIQEGSLIRIYICLFDENQLQRQNMVEVFTVQIRWEPDDTTTVNLSWHGLGEICADVRGKGKKSQSIEDFLRRLPPVRGRLHTLMRHQIKETARENWSRHKTKYDLRAAQKFMARRPGHQAETDCVSIHIPRLHQSSSITSVSSLDADDEANDITMRESQRPRQIEKRHKGYYKAQKRKISEESWDEMRKTAEATQPAEQTKTKGHSNSNKRMKPDTPSTDNDARSAKEKQDKDPKSSRQRYTVTEAVPRRNRTLSKHERGHKHLSVRETASDKFDETQRLGNTGSEATQIDEILTVFAAKHQAKALNHNSDLGDVDTGTVSQRLRSRC